MPTNFNQTLQTVSPNIQSYQPETASGIGDAFNQIGGAIKDFLDSKAAAQESATIGAGADEYLNLIQDQSTALADVRNQQNQLGDALANEADEGKRKDLMRQVAALDARSRQMRVDMGPQRIALFRRFVRENPHLVDVANKTFGGLQNTAENMLQDGSKVAADPSVQAITAIREEAAKTGVDVDTMTDSMRLGLEAKNSANRLQQQRDIGAAEFPDLTRATVATQEVRLRDLQLMAIKGRWNSSQWNLYIEGELANTLAADDQALIQSFMGDKGVLGQAEYDNIVQARERVLVRARNMAQQYETNENRAREDAKTKIGLEYQALAAGYGPLWAAFTKDNPEAAYRIGVTEPIKLWNQLRAEENSLLAQKAVATKAGGRAGILANTPGASNLDARLAANRAQQATVAGPLMAVDRASYIQQHGGTLKQSVDDAYRQVIPSIVAGTFDPKNYPPGLLHLIAPVLLAPGAETKAPDSLEQAQVDLVLDTQIRDTITSNNTSIKGRVLREPMRSYLESPKGSRAKINMHFTIDRQLENALSGATLTDNVLTLGNGVQVQYNPKALEDTTGATPLLQMPSLPVVGTRGNASALPLANRRMETVEAVDRINTAWTIKLNLPVEGRDAAATQEEFRQRLGIANEKQVVK